MTSLLRKSVYRLANMKRRPSSHEVISALLKANEQATQELNDLKNRLASLESISDGGVADAVKAGTARAKLDAVDNAAPANEGGDDEGASVSRWPRRGVARRPLRGPAPHGTPRR